MDHDVKTHLHRNLEALADHCLSRLALPNDRSLVGMLYQPEQIDNRAALTCWIETELMDPDLDRQADLVEVMTARLALVLVREYPYRWGEMLGGLMGEGVSPNLRFLEAMRRVAAGDQP